MADIILKQNGGRRLRAIPRVDLTPMVDLGFLLITFFIFTTSLVNHKTMPLNMPAPAKGTNTVFPEESTVTLIPTTGHKVLYYYGSYKELSSMKSSSVADVVGLMLTMKSSVAGLPETLSEEAHKVHVIIKPDEDCVYDDVVQLLDAMLIADVPYYAIADISAIEKDATKAIKNH